MLNTINDFEAGNETSDKKKKKNYMHIQSWILLYVFEDPSVLKKALATFKFRLAMGLGTIG